ncbi:MAG TPA: lipo-like protein [Pseudolabrys sp.]|nr:lipo-like protein [Pseudolabrys sp.]
MGARFFGFVGQRIVRYLEQPSPGYEPFTPSNLGALKRAIEPGDVLLVEGNSRVAGVIKYLTQSTWSHSALYVGDVMGKKSETGEPHVLIEVLLGEGTISAPLSKYEIFHTRICRPIGLTERDRAKVCRYMLDRLGYEYDVKNIVDLIRYLVPLPVPQRWRRRLIALGSGVPTKAICSTLIAQAFGSVRYPILPRIELIESKETRREILHIRHYSLYAPRDFDISPYFAIVKPTIAVGFNYKKLRWANLPLPPEEAGAQAPRPLPAAGRGTPAAGSHAKSENENALPRRKGRAPESALDISVGGP